MKIGLLGCGAIGERRGSQTKEHQIVGVYDPDQIKAKALALKFSSQIYESEDELIQNSGAQLIIVAAVNSALAPLALKSVKAGRNVLVEKPGAITVKELDLFANAAVENKVAVKVGFNHRFHPAILKAREFIDQGALGDLMFLRARYGHGGRVGYEKEWRSIPALGGGGELMDQGVHILDLIYWFFGPLPLQSSFVATSFWNMSVDDNAVLTLGDKKKWATFHVSCSEWKNTFALEIYGRKGKILINGLGRSYGTESLTYYQMLPEMGPPKIENFEFPEPDQSWYLDLKNLIDHVEKKTPLWGDLNSAKYSLEQVTKAYKQNGFTNLPCSV